MPVSASIYGGSRPRVAPITALDAMLEQAQRQDVRLKSQQNQQAFDDDQATRQASMASGGDQNKLLQLLQSGGQYKAAQALRKTMLDADKSRADIAGVGAKTKETLTDNQVKQIGIHTDMLSNVQNPDDAMQWAQIGKDSGALTEPQYQMALKNIQRVSQDPQAFNQWKNQAALGAKKYIEMNKPVFSTVNAGNAQVTTAREGLTGQVMPSLGQSTPILQSANSIADNAVSEANNRRSVAASMSNAAATRDVAKATRDAGYAQRDMNTEMKLGDDYRTQSKIYKEVSDAYRQINNTLDKATTSPAATLAAATKFMKLLDPGSVVRESELGMALAATGVLDRAANYYNTLKSGKVLTANQVKDFKNITEQIHSAAQDSQKAIDKDYTAKAKTYGLRPEMIIQDLGQNATGSIPQAIPPAGIPADIADLIKKHNRK